MARAVVSPFDPFLPCNGLKLRDLPVQRVASHCNQKLCDSVHRSDDTAGNIIVQAPRGGDFWGLTFELTGPLRQAAQGPIGIGADHR